MIRTHQTASPLLAPLSDAPHGSTAPEPFRGDTHMCEIVFPEDTNPLGKMFGGRALQLMDKAAGVAAARYCHTAVVTAASDRVDFAVPIDSGEIIELIARVVYTGRSTMVVRVNLYAEGRHATRRQLCTTGHYTMVSVDDDHHPMSVPEFVPETETERKAHERARLSAKRTKDARG